MNRVSASSDANLPNKPNFMNNSQSSLQQHYTVNSKDSLKQLQDNSTTQNLKIEKPVNKTRVNYGVQKNLKYSGSY